MTLEIGSKASSKIITDARNDILDRPVNPASIVANCNIPGVFVAVRGPKNGVANAEAHADLETKTETEGLITVTLNVEDGPTFTTSRPCKIIPARKPDPRPGAKTTPIPAYQIIRVWKVAPENQPEAVTWETFPNPWNDAKIGTWELNEDELCLYVNMDERQFRTERARLTNRHGDNYTQRVTARYVAYLAFHLFQLHEQSQGQSTKQGDDQDEEYASNAEERSSENGGLYDPDAPEVARELDRVAATLIQTLRSETELLRLEAETDN